MLTRIVLQRSDETMGRRSLFSFPEADVSWYDDGYIQLILHIMGRMCDGQNTVLQVSVERRSNNTPRQTFLDVCQIVSCGQDMLVMQDVT